jgi:membrane-associated phospholipid phosphatase
MVFVTDFADLGLLLPLVVLVGLGLAAGGLRREALAWAAAIAATLVAILVLKRAVLGAPPLARLLGQPSGHTAAGIVAYAGLAVLAAGNARARRLLALPAALACWIVFGGSRLALGVHAPRDVVVGGAVGTLGVLALVARAGAPSPRPRARALVVAACAGVLAVTVFHGQRLHAERHLRAIAAELRAAPP